MSTIKPIKICCANDVAIKLALTQANGRARAHTFNIYATIGRLAVEAEEALAAFGVTKANRSGATYFATSGGFLPKAYNNKSIQTAVWLERRSNDWYLTHACTMDLWPRQNPKKELTVTQEQADEAIKRLLATVTIKRAEQTAA